VQPWNVLGRVGIWGVRQRLADHHSVLNSLKLRGRTEVPDRRNPSGGVLDKIMLGEDQIRGDDLGENFDQLLDRDTVGSRAGPDLEQVIVDSRYEIAFGAGKVGYIEKLGNGASGNKHVVGRTGIVLNAKSEPHGGEGGSGCSKSGQLSRSERDRDVGEIRGSWLFSWSRDRRAEQSEEDGDDAGDSDHFLAFSNEGG